MPEEIFKRNFIEKYDSLGESKFYKFLLSYAIDKFLKIKDNNFKNKELSPELELLEYSDKFLILYRRDDKIVYLNISKIFRKAAHKIYRIMLKKNLIQRNRKFLNLV